MFRSDVRRFLQRPAARGLTRKGRAVYEVLLACGKPDLSGELNFGVVRDAWIMAQTGYSESSVYRARKELVGAGLVQVVQPGEGRAQTHYLLVLEAVGIEVELFEQRAQQLVAEARAGGFTDTSQGGAVGPPAGLSQVESLKAQPGHSDPSAPSKTAPPTRAHPEFFPETPPQPLASSAPGYGEEAPLRGPELHLASGSAAAASSCPKALSRGAPCASCRACGTNPREQRRRAAAERASQRVPDILATGTPPPLRSATNARGLAEVRAAWAARETPQAASDEGVPARADPSSTPGGAS